MTYHYRYCGLILDSELPLPELPTVTASTQPDLTICLAQVPNSLDDASHCEVLYEHNGREAIWRLDGVARYRVSDGGRRIDVALAPLADDASVRLFLLQPVFALASIMRGDWLLNAAAVERQGEVTAFIGPSASGKSTNAAILLGQGYRLVSDSLLRVTRDSAGRMLAHPQAPWLWLWPDTLHELGYDSAPTLPVRHGIALRQLSLPTIDEALPLARIGILQEQKGNDMKLFEPTARHGQHAFETLLHHTAGNHWLVELGQRQTLFHWSIALARAARVERLAIPWGWEHLPRLGKQMDRWCRQLSDS